MKLITKTLRSADGTPIHAEALGDRTKPSVVFIHGFSMSSMVWSDIFSDPLWSDEVYLVAYDGRGHGRSGKPEDEAAWTSKRIAEDFDAVVDGFGLNRPFVAAWSFGGVNMADILSLHPHSYISGAILISGFPYISSLATVCKPYGLTLIPPLTATDSVPNFQDAAIKFITSLTSPPYRMPHPLRQAALGDIMVQPRICSARILTRTQDEKGFLSAGEKGLPLLIINGKEDLLVNGEANAKACREGSGRKKGWKDLKVVVLDNVGHTPFLENPELFRKEVLDFVRRISEPQLVRLI